MTFRIRNFKQNQFPQIHQWAEEEKWDVGIYDYQAYKTIGQDGFFFGELDEKPIGFIGTGQYDEKIGFIGLFIVKPQYRGKGYGKKLLKFALQRFQNRGVHNVGLESIRKQISLYQGYNFKICHYTERYYGFGTNNNFFSNNLKLLKDIPLKHISKYDQLCFFAKREKFIQKWISLPESFAVGFVQNEQLRGYTVLRKSTFGFKVGPLFADSVQIADQLLKAACGRIPQNVRFTIEIPEDNPHGKLLVEKYKMTYISKTVRMYTAEKPEIPVQTKIFGITTLSFG